MTNIQYSLEVVESIAKENNTEIENISAASKNQLATVEKYNTITLGLQDLALSLTKQIDRMRETSKILS